MEPKDQLRGLELGDAIARDREVITPNAIAPMSVPATASPLMTSWSHVLPEPLPDPADLRSVLPTPEPLAESVIAPILEHASELDADSGVHAADSDSPSERTLEVLAACDPSDPRFETVDDPRIPADQMYFKIGEVAKITGIKPYVLRYWEVEFPWIRPEKTSSRQRRYRRQDIALLFRIGRLRYEEQLTIDRTRQVIREDRRQESASTRGGSHRSSRASRKRVLSSGLSGPAPTVEGGAISAVFAAADEPIAQLSLGLGGVARSKNLARALAEMRKTVLELLEAVEE